MVSTYTNHAHIRSAQRNISADQIQTVIEHGRRFYGHRAVHYFFGRKEAQQFRPLLGAPVERLEGAVVVVSHQGDVLTTYRNRDALKRIRCKVRRPRARQRQQGKERHYA